MASLPWVALVTIVAAALWAGFRPLKGWVVFTGVFAWLALGPFVVVAQQLTYVPDAVGAPALPADHRRGAHADAYDDPGDARPVDASRHGRARICGAARATRGSWRPPSVRCSLFELLPAPRTLDSAEIPAVYQVVAADPRPIRVLSLPFGLRDGLSSRGNYSSSSQFYQTLHEKRLVGGYISRLPNRSIERYRRNPTLRVLLRLSEGTPVEPELYEHGTAEAERTLRRLQIGYVVIDPSLCSPELVAFAQRAFQTTLVMKEGGLELYRTPMAPDTAEVAEDRRES